MTDYTSLGIQKLVRQATQDLSLIRCPRDSVVMRVLRCRAERPEGDGSKSGEFRRAPRSADWRVKEVDLECPACRRRAMGLRLVGDCPEDRAAASDDAVAAEAARSRRQGTERRGRPERRGAGPAPGPARVQPARVAHFIF